MLSPTRLGPRRVMAIAASLLLTTGCGSALSASTAAPAAHEAAVAPLRAAAPGTGGVRVVAAGDIACPPGGVVTSTTCQQGATASLARRLRPALVLTLGDTQYEKSSLAEIQGAYARTWGGLLTRTRPTIGNHEYHSPGANGYYTYFRSRQPGPPGYYALSVGGWRVYVLNSNCDRVSCATEARWLRGTMATHPSRCSLVTMHHPRYSSGLEHGNDTAVRPLWAAAYQHRTELVLSGHDHDYERFGAMDAAGHLRPRLGIQEFVVGTGGRNLYQMGTRKLGSAYFENRIHGVLALDLRPGSYGWSFHAIDGRVLDQGTRRCH